MQNYAENFIKFDFNAFKYICLCANSQKFVSPK